MSTAPDILALGEPLVEMMQVAVGEDGHPRYRQSFGGDTSNAIIAAARQGARTGYISAVGDDPFGQGLIDLWNAEGVSTDLVVTRKLDPTGVYFVKPHASGRNFWYARRGSAASLVGPDDLPETVIAEARVLHLSALSQAISPNMRAAVQRAAEIARANNTLVSFDTNLRLNLWSLEEAREAILSILPLTDIVLPSDDEASILTGLSSPDDLITHFHGYGPEIVVLKQGANGATVATPDFRHRISPHASQPVDSTGAGDSFAGAFLAYYLETGDPERAGMLAGIVAAGTVSGHGAIDPIPRREAVLAAAS